VSVEDMVMVLMLRKSRNDMATKVEDMGRRRRPRTPVRVRFCGASFPPKLKFPFGHTQYNTTSTMAPKRKSLGSEKAPKKVCT
jgi:hypothetical protein